MRRAVSLISIGHRGALATKNIVSIIIDKFSIVEDCYGSPLCQLRTEGHYTAFVAVGRTN